MNFGDPILLEIIPPKAHPHNAGATYLFQCTYCNVEFLKPEYRVRGEGNQFCSKRCRYAYQKKHSVRSWVCMKRGVYKNCETCSKEFHVNNFRKNQARFCSYECYWQTLKGQTFCLENQFTSEATAGKKNIAWRGGISCEPYTTTFFEIQDWVRHRDGYSCQLCDGKTNGMELDIHHVDYNKKNDDETNLVSLCKRCHALTGFNRTNWIYYFKHLGEMETRWQLGR